MDQNTWALIKNTAADLESLSERLSAVHAELKAIAPLARQKPGVVMKERMNEFEKRLAMLERRR